MKIPSSDHDDHPPTFEVVLFGHRGNQGLLHAPTGRVASLASGEGRNLLEKEGKDISDDLIQGELFIAHTAILKSIDLRSESLMWNTRLISSYAACEARGR